MSGWDFEEVGGFDDETAAKSWAERQGVDLRDIHTRRDGGGVRLSVRRSSLGDRGNAPNDLSFGRRSGW